MKTPTQLKSGLTLIEIVVAIAVLTIVAAVLFASLNLARSRASRINCTTQLKSVGLVYRQWAMDHGDHFPSHVSTTQGGTMELTETGSAGVQFQVLSNEVNTPKVLLCPADESRTAAPDFASLTDANLSYFVGLDADEGMNEMILSGDRNLTADGVEVGIGLFVLGRGERIGWSTNLHNRFGNLGFADGSVQPISSAHFQDLSHNNPQTNRLAVP